MDLAELTPADVPPSEIEARLVMFQSALAGQSIDGALIVEATNLYYLTGTSQDAHLIVPAEGEPVLGVRNDLERAAVESPLGRIEPLTSLRQLPDLLASVGLEDARIGLELDVLPAARYLGYAAQLEHADLVDISPSLREQRSVKSAWEIDRIREAAEMVVDLHVCLEEFLAPGMREVEVAAELERWVRRRGHQGVVRMHAFNADQVYGTVVAGVNANVPGSADAPLVGAGVGPAHGKGASSRPICEGDPLIVDILGTSAGYLADQTRTFGVGRVSDRVRGAYERSVEIVHAVAAAACPGVGGSELFGLAEEIAGDLADEYASRQRISFVGHGFGLELDEPPFLARGYDAPLREGMVFALEPKFVLPGIGAVGLENAYVVTSTGVDLLTRAPEELIEIGVGD